MTAVHPRGMLLPAALAIVVNLILPAYFIAALWRAEATRLGWLLKVLYTAAFIGWLFLAGRWDWVSYYLRFVFVAALLATAILSHRRAAPREWAVPSGRLRAYGAAAVTLALFVALCAWSLLGRWVENAPVRLAFPLRDGWYSIAHGGSTLPINHHHANAAQRYAVDIVGLGASATRARGIYPARLDRYAVFGATVYTPCDGKVSAVVDGLPNLVPPASDPERPAGNHIVLACQGVNVVLAHLDTGSITVEPGATVMTGQPLARVGNSGNTSEPHLHVHAARADSADPLAGTGVPMLFDGRFPVRNMTFESRARR